MLGLTWAALTSACGAEEGSGHRGPPVFANSRDLFGPDLRTEETCARLFRPEALAEASGLDIANLPLKVSKRGRCGVAGQDGDLQLELSIFRVKDTVQAARSMFEMRTQSMTHEEIASSMLAVEERAKDDDPSKMVDREATADLARAMPAPTYVEVSGIGDRARMTTTMIGPGSKTVYCEIHVLVRNASFSVVASAADLSKDETVDVAKKVAALVSRELARM